MKTVKLLKLASLALVAALAACAGGPVPSKAGAAIPTPAACAEIIAKGGRC